MQARADSHMTACKQHPKRQGPERAAPEERRGLSGAYGVPRRQQCGRADCRLHQVISQQGRLRQMETHGSNVTSAAWYERRQGTG